MNGDLRRAPRLLIPDNSPLSILSMGGHDALDYLFAPGVEVWITDMVQMEATREPDPGDDQRRAQRKLLKEWLAGNSNRIRIMDTDTGTEYRNAMANWVAGGRMPETKPCWKGRGEQSLFDILSVAESVVEESEAVVLLVDDKRARAVLRLTEGLNLDIMTTETFVRMAEQEFGVTNATEIWPVIRMAAGTNEHGKSRIPDAPLEDPIYVRNRPGS
jgi:hypothetical protein